MTKKLILYWYVPSDGWHPIYDLHVANLAYYKDRFDCAEIIISTDPDTPQEHINQTLAKIRNIFPNITVTPYPNNKELREAKYFRDEIALKLGTFDDDVASFFVHNKGVGSRYVTPATLNDWINFMYFANLYDIDTIDTMLNRGSVCCIGTFSVKDCRPKNMPFLKYNWHYSGTFFWFIPSRIQKRIEEKNECIPDGNRFIAEGFLGSVLPYDENTNIHRFGNIQSCLKCSEFVNSIPPQDLEKYRGVVSSLGVG